MNTGLKIRAGHQTMSNQTKNISDITFCPTGKAQGKIKYPIRLCVCPTMNWRCPIKLLIFSNKYLSNKSFLINKLQYPKYSFLQKHLYQKTLQKYNSKSFVFMSSSANKKEHWIQNNFFCICEHFMIPLKEAGMKLSISDSLEYWCGLVEYAKKILSLARVTRQWCKIFAVPRNKGWSDVLY